MTSPNSLSSQTRQAVNASSYPYDGISDHSTTMNEREASGSVGKSRMIANRSPVSEQRARGCESPQMEYWMESFIFILFIFHPPQFEKTGCPFTEGTCWTLLQGT
jgi:hypothetical protein